MPGLGKLLSGALTARFSGVFAPLAAPFDGEELSPQRLRDNITLYNETRLAGYVLNGSTGESVLLTWGEVETLWRAAAEVAAPGKLLIAGTGAESTPETIRMTKRAAEIGFHAALVRTPSYYKPQMTEAAEAEHFLRVADASAIPILIYSVPVFTGYAVEPSLAGRLAGHPNIAGMKDSSGDAARAQAVLAAVSPAFRLLVGSARLLADAVRLGASGAILAVACIFPDLTAEIYEAAQSGNAARADELQALLSEAGAVASRLGIPAVKAAMEMCGYYGGPVRAPLLPLNRDQKLEVRSMVEKVLAGAANTPPAPHK